MNIYQQIINKITQAQNILITAHKSPDGDSIGSSVALLKFIQKIHPNANTTICHPDEAPNYLKFLKGSESILNYENSKDKIDLLFENADLIFSLDYNHSNRLGSEMQPIFDNTNCYKILIDHHLFPAEFSELSLSNTKVSSTCQLIYELIENSNSKEYLDESVANALYLGMMTDTGSFRFSSVTYRTHEIIAELLKVGVKQHLIHEAIYDTNTLDRLKLKGYAQSEKLKIVHDGKVAYIGLLNSELNQFNHQKGDTEGLVNIALSVEGVKIACLFTQSDNYIKLSIRSKSEFPINELASSVFSGGGHANASGGKFNGTMDEAIETFIKNVKDYL